MSICSTLRRVMKRGKTVMADQATPKGCVVAPLVEAAEARRRRLWDAFDAIDFLDRTIVELIDANKSQFRERGASHRVLLASYGKALKTLRALRIVCESGYGEDGVILARALVNLAINLAFIGKATDPDERAAEFIADGQVRHRKFLRQWNDERTERWESRFDWKVIEERAERWETNIWKRATETGLQEVYDESYRFGSSYEHSDAASLGSYYDASDETQPKINAGPSDDFIFIALGCGYQAMIVLTSLMISAFGLKEEKRRAAIMERYQRLGQKDVKAQSS